MLFEKGLKRYEIAPLVGVSAYTVGQWIKAWKKGGQAALKVGNKGRPRGLYRKLLPHEEQEIRRAITDRCPDQLKLPFALWTRQAVQTLIKQKYSVDLSLQAVSNYLNMWGFSPQKPIRRAYERNDQRVRIWLEKVYPAIAARARQEKAEIHWGDETGLRSDDVKGRGYAPKGKTPVQYVKAAPEKLNMISTVTNRGLMRFMFYRANTFEIGSIELPFSIDSRSGKHNGDRLSIFSTYTALYGFAPFHSGASGNKLG